MNTEIGTQVPLLPNAQGMYEQIETHQEPTARNMILLRNQLVHMLRSIHCEIENTGNYNFSFIMFKAGEFLLLPGICTPAVEAQPNAQPPVVAQPVQPGTAYVLPTDPGITPATTTGAGLQSFNFRREQWNLYQQVLNLTRMCFKKAYPTGGHMLAMEDEYGCINDHPLTIYNDLWDLAITDEEKDSCILENEKELTREYDPSEPVNVYYTAIQLAVSTLQRLGEPASPRTVIRNCLAQFRQHADLSHACRKWIRDQTGLSPTWETFKKHFSKAIRLIQNDPSTKKALNMANNVQNSVLTNKDNISTIAREVVPLQDTVATLQKEIETIKNTPASPPQLANGTSQVTSELTKIKAELAALKKKKI